MPACRAPRTAPWCLHTAPEAADGGPLALVENGDEIELDVPSRRLVLHVPEEELARRRAAWRPPSPHSDRGYLSLYLDHVMQADTGADLDFLVGRSGAEVPREEPLRPLRPFPHSREGPGETFTIAVRPAR